MPGPPYRGTPMETQAVKNEYLIGQENGDWPTSPYLTIHLAAGLFFCSSGEDGMQTDREMLPRNDTQCCGKLRRQFLRPDQTRHQ